VGHQGSLVEEALSGRLSRLAEVVREEFELVASFIGRSGFLSWEEEYLPSGTDLPPYTLTVVRGSEMKRVSAWGYSPGPPDFHVIARLVDGVADRIEWEPIDGSAGGRPTSDRRAPGDAAEPSHGE